MMRATSFCWPPAAAIFDMDGLMLDTERIYHRTFRKVGLELGYPLSDELLLATSGRTFQDGYRMLQESLGPDFPLASFQARWPVLWYADVAAHGIPRKPGLVELLDWLDEERIPKAVATSSYLEEAVFTLRASGLAERFATVVNGGEIVNGKPAPDIYLLAAARLEVNPAHCVAFEDSEPGVLAAAAAGMYTIMVPDTHQPSGEVAARAALVAPTLHEARLHLLALKQAGPQ
jgi:beta-phosphoglucomutase-like phosphatase (HAD superfamily)